MLDEICQHAISDKNGIFRSASGKNGICWSQPPGGIDISFWKKDNNIVSFFETDGA